MVRKSDLVQIESITVSWCDEDKIEEYATKYGSGQFGDIEMGQIALANLEHPDDSCHLCA